MQLVQAEADVRVGIQTLLSLLALKLKTRSIRSRFCRKVQQGKETPGQKRKTERNRVQMLPISRSKNTQH